MSGYRLGLVVGVVAVVVGATGPGGHTSKDPLSGVNASVGTSVVQDQTSRGVRRVGEFERTRALPPSAADEPTFAKLAPVPGAPAITKIERVGKWLRPVLDQAKGGATTGAFEISLPLRADEPFILKDNQSGVSVEATLVGLEPVPAEVKDGYVLYRRAHPGGGDLLQRPTGHGTEDFVTFETRPAQPVLSYSISLGASVAGLRLVANTLELLDADAVPRLRAMRPYIIDSAGMQHEVTVAMPDCAFDGSPLPPWGRPITAPGASRCTLRLTWADDNIAYPALLDPAWTAIVGMMTTERVNHTGTLLDPALDSNHIARVLVAGGRSALGARTASADLYDPATNSFTPTGSMACARELHTATLLRDGRVLVVGGLSSGDGQPGGLPDSVCPSELYNPATGMWITVATGNTDLPVWGHGASRIDAGGSHADQVMVTGGRVAPTGIPTAQTWFFDPSTDTFASAPEMPGTRYLHGQASEEGGPRVVIAGGKCPDCTPPNSSFEFNGSVWSAAGDTGPSQETPVVLTISPDSADVLKRSRAIMVGGGSSGTATNTSQIYVFGEQGWTSNNHMTTARTEHRGTVLIDGRVLVAGGRGSGGTVLASVEVWYDVDNPNTPSVNEANTWFALDSMTTPRASHTVTGMQAGKVLAAGGVDASGASLATAEVFPIDVIGPPRCDPACPGGYECLGANECVLSQCPTGSADCDANSTNGCETSTTTTENCGVCGNVCSPGVNTIAACVGGSCESACVPGFSDCDGDPSNGCESDLNSASSCGSCGVSCGDGNSCTLDTCTAGACTQIDQARCVNPNPIQTDPASCSFVSSFPGCENPDTDGDGLADVWEDAQAIDLNCDGIIDSNDVMLPGANKYVADIYLKASAMESTPDEIPNLHVPTEEAVRRVVAMFGGSHLKTTPMRCDAATPCTEAGFACSEEDFVCQPMCSTDADCTAGTDGGHCVEGMCLKRRLHFSLEEIDIIPHTNVVTYGPVNAACILGGDTTKGVNFYDIKTDPASFDPKTALFSRYGVFGHFNSCDSPESCAVCSADSSGSPHSFGTSGLSEVIGNDLVVSLGAFPMPTVSIKDIRDSAALAHELGHSLGLRHGGPDCDALPAGESCDYSPDTDRKPNYVSVMGYSYNFGIRTTATPGTTILSPTIAIDYSHGRLGTLDEKNLDEANGVSPGFQPPFDKYLVKYWTPSVSSATRYGSTNPGTPIDWNANAIATEISISENVNNDANSADTFTSADDWSHLVYKFQCNWDFLDGAPPPPNYTPAREIDPSTAQQVDELFTTLLVRLEVRKECIDTTSNGVHVPDVVYGSADFNVLDIDVSTLRLAEATAMSVSYPDRNGDGFLDLSARFRSSDLVLHLGDNIVVVTGKLKNGQSFQGYDNVKAVEGNIAHCEP